MAAFHGESKMADTLPKGYEPHDVEARWRDHWQDNRTFTPDPEQPEFYTGEKAPHIVFTPYLRALAAQLTEGITSPAEKAKRIYDYVTLNVRYHFQPSYFVHAAAGETAASWR
jgi:transglutaminase-like putative cysteine protease